MTFPFGWSRRAPLTIHADGVAGAGGQLVDFPVLLREGDLPDEALDTSIGLPAQADGGDIRITADKAGTQLLETEIFVWDQAAQKAVIWTLAPALDQESDTTLWVWWGSDNTQSLPAATVLENSLGANAQAEQAWSEQFDYLRRDPRELMNAAAAAPTLILDLKRLEATQSDGTRLPVASLPGFSYARSGRTTVYRDGETRIVEADAIPVGDLGYAPQPATTQLLGVDPLDLTTASSVSTTIADLGPLQIFRRVSVQSQGGSAAGSRLTASFAAVAGQPFSVQWYFQAGTSGQAFLEALNLDSLGFGLIRGPVGGLAVTREDATFGAFSGVRFERLAGGVWRVSATVTPAETATYRLGIGPNSATAGEDIIALAMSAQDEAMATALIPDALAARGADDMRVTGLTDLDAGTLAVAGSPETSQLDEATWAAVLSDGTLGEQIQIGYFESTGRFISQTRSGGVFAGGVSGEGPWRGHEIGARTWSATGNLWADSATGEGSGGAAPPVGLDMLSIGGNLGASHMAGEIAWVALWDSALGQTDLRRLRAPGRSLASIGLQSGQTIGVSLEYQVPTSSAQSGLQVEYWAADGGWIASDEVTGTTGVSGRLSMAPVIPANAAWLRCRAQDSGGPGGGFMSRSGVLRRNGDFSPPESRSSDWIETRRNNEFLDDFLATGAVVALASGGIAAAMATADIRLAAKSRVLLRLASAALGSLRVSSAGLLRVSGVSRMTAPALLLATSASFLTPSAVRRIRAADGLPANATVHGRRTLRVREIGSDN